MINDEMLMTIQCCATGTWSIQMALLENPSFTPECRNILEKNSKLLHHPE